MWWACEACSAAALVRQCCVSVLYKTILSPYVSFYLNYVQLCCSAQHKRPDIGESSIYFPFQREGIITIIRASGSEKSLLLCNHYIYLDGAAAAAAAGWPWISRTKGQTEVNDEQSTSVELNKAAVCVCVWTQSPSASVHLLPVAGAKLMFNWGGVITTVSSSLAPADRPLHQEEQILREIIVALSCCQPEQPRCRLCSLLCCRFFVVGT